MVQELIPSLNWINLSGSPFSCYSQGELSMRNARSLLARILGQSKNHNDTDPTPFILNRLTDVLPQSSSTECNLQSKEPFVLLIQCFIYLSSNQLLGLQKVDRFLTWIFESGSASLFNRYISRLQRVPTPSLKVFLGFLLLSAVSIEKAGLVSNLLRLNVDPNCKNSSYGLCSSDSGSFDHYFINRTTTPLQLASIRSNEQISRLLVLNGAKVDATCFYLPFSPLELAISLNHGNFRIAERLIESGANIDLPCEKRNIQLLDPYSLFFTRTKTTLLRMAVHVQNIAITRLLLSRGAPVNDVSSDLSGGALLIAIGRNDLDLVELLLQAGANVNIAPHELEMSASRFFEYQAERWLPANEEDQEDQRGVLKDACDAFDAEEEKDDFGEVVHREDTFSSPISFAARRNKMTLVQRLLDAGAIVNGCPDYDKVWTQVSIPTLQSGKRRFYEYMMDESRGWFQSPLHEAVMNGNVQLTTLLLDHGAAVNTRNASGATPLQLACGLDEADDDEIEEIDEVRIKMAQLLLSRGAELNASPGPMRGRTAFQAALEKGHEELAEHLLALGADINAPSSAQGGLNAPQAASRGGNCNLVLLLVRHGALFTAEMRWIALYMAASLGDLPAVEQFLEQDAEVNALYSPDGMPDIAGSILQASIRSRNVEVTRKVLDAGADLDMVAEGEPALCTAVREDDGDALNLLLSRGANPSPWGTKITPLSIAAEQGNKDVVECLIQAGADVDQLSYSTWVDRPDQAFATPLFWTVDAIRRRLHERPRGTQVKYHNMAIVLLSHGADPNGGLGAAGILGLACDAMDVVLVEELLNRGANPRTSDWKGQFPIHSAAKTGNKKIVQLLLAAGANVNALTRESPSRTTLECAIPHYSYDDYWEDREEVVTILIKAGAHIKNKGLLLARALKCLLFRVASDLLQIGADVNYTVSELEKPLQLAIESNRYDIAQLLIDQGADVNTRSGSSGLIFGFATPLQFAACYGHFNIAKLLIENGADINAAPVIGAGESEAGTALQLAAQEGRLDLVYLLLENDADVDLIQSRCNEAVVYADRKGHNILARLLREYIPRND